MLPTIRIFTFGTLQVVRGEHLVTESDWHTRQARQLLKILLTERPRPVSTDRLIELLWTTSTPDAAATTLRSAINALRNVLEPERANRAPSRYVVTQNPGYAFQPQPEVWLDVDHFEQKCGLALQQDDPAQRRQLLEEAVALYQDDYLTSDPYADWAQAERERLRERYFGALLALAEVQATRGDYAAAIGNVRRMLARDEVRENGWQALMRYQAESGDSAGALLSYERIRTILAEELGADPSPLTQSWHQKILNGEVAPREIAPQPPPTATGEARRSGVLHPAHLPQQVILPSVDVRANEPLVGRDVQLAEMKLLLEATLRGEGALLMLEGESGVGKTRLAVTLLQHAAAAGATVISASCQAIERNLPFAALADVMGRYLENVPDAVLDGLPRTGLAQLAQVVPALHDRLVGVQSGEGGESLEENRLRLVDGIVACLVALAQVRPLVLFLDDLHWADAESLTLVSRLARRVGSAPLLLVLAWRSDDLAENEALEALLRTLRTKQIGRILSVPRFQIEEVQRFVAARMGEEGEWSDDLAQLLFELTRGNPLYIGELLRDLLERTPAALSDEAAAALDGALRQSFGSQRNRRLQELILERMERLPDDALWVLQLGAVIARDFSLELLELAATSDPLAGLEVLLERNFLIERADQRLDFNHQIVRQVAFETMSALQRRRWHLRVAEGLVQLRRAEQNPAEAAFHFGRAGAQGALRYAQFAVLAGEKLLRTYGFHQSIDYFDDALSVLEKQPDMSAHLAGVTLHKWIERALQGRALAFESLFDVEGAIDSWQRTLKLARRQNDPNLLLRTHSRMATVLGLMGQARESHKLLQDLVAMLGESEGAQMDNGSAPLGSLVIADLLARRNVLYGAEYGVENELESPERGWAPYTPPPPAVADPVGDLLGVLEPVHAALPLFDYGWTLLVQGQLGEATQCLSAVVDLAIETVQPSLASTALHQLAATARILGELDQSQALNERSVALNREVMGTAAALASMWPRIASALLSLQAGRIEEAEARLRRVLAALGDRSAYSNYRNSANIGMGLVALARGELEAARTLLEGALADSINLYPYMHVRALHGLTRIARAQGNDARADALLRHALAFSGRRSLLEEYIETVLEIALQRPAGAPVTELIEALMEYVRPIHFTAAVRRLEAALPLGQVARVEA